MSTDARYSCNPFHATAVAKTTGRKESLIVPGVDMHRRSLNQTFSSMSPSSDSRPSTPVSLRPPYTPAWRHNGTKRAKQSRRDRSSTPEIQHASHARPGGVREFEQDRSVSGAVLPQFEIQKQEELDNTTLKAFRALLAYKAWEAQTPDPELAAPGSEAYGYGP